MPSIKTLGWLAALSLTMALLVLPMAQGQSPAEKPAAQTEKPTVVKPGEAKPDPFAVPDASPQVLMGYITKMISGPPPKDMETLKKMRKAILTAAEKILAGKPNEQELTFAVQAKMNMLDTPEQLTAFIEDLKKAGHDEAARMVRGFVLLIRLRDVEIGEKKDVRPLIAQSMKYLEEAPPRISDLNLAHMTGVVAENTGNREWAKATYGKLIEIFTAAKDEKFADFIEVLEGVMRRLDLVGHEMKLDGKLLDGEPLDWPSYAGKVVLVIFWTTEYPPCTQEVPAWKALYEQYRDRGFEIVGISLDSNNNAFEDFVRTEEVPWPNVVGDGKPNPAMIYYGVTNLPTLMLVGKDGKVIATDLPAAELKKKLEELLGPEGAKPESREDK